MWSNYLDRTSHRRSVLAEWNRRQFLRTIALTSGAAAGGITIGSLGGNVVAALGSVQPRTTPGTTGSAWTGTLVIGNSEGNPEHLDLLLTPAFVTRQNVGPCHAFLVGLTVDNELGARSGHGVGGRRRHDDLVHHPRRHDLPQRSNPRRQRRREDVRPRARCRDRLDLPRHARGRPRVDRGT